jgi:hypothetical protein
VPEYVIVLMFSHVRAFSPGSDVKREAQPTWRGQDFKRVSVCGIKLAVVAEGIPYQLPVTVAAWRFWAVSPRSFDIIDG